MSVIELKESKKDQNLENLKHEVSVDYHKIELDALVERFKTNVHTGLTDDQARDILQINGPNRLTPPKKTSEIVKFLKALTTGFSLLLLGGGFLCFVAYGIAYIQSPDAVQDNLFLGVVLVMVVLITAAVSYYQESKSSRIMDSFKKLVPQESSVLRSGKKIYLPAVDVVVGDIIFLKGGDLIPADVRVIEANSFKVDNSSLTGESEPQKRIADFTNDNLLETANVAFAFTYAVEGTCKGIVVSTGDNTVMGRIAKLTSGLVSGKTPIGREIERFIKIITAIAVTIGVIFFILYIAISPNKFLEAVIFLIGIIVANVPEGLLVTVTMALTLTAKKMASKNCLVKNLESVETLGSTSVICSDKTGTLTQNRMTVSHIWVDQVIKTTSTAEDTARNETAITSKAEKMLLNISAICNRAEFRSDQDFDEPILRWITDGDASESALIKYSELYNVPIKETRAKYPKMFEIPFNSVNKYQLSVHEQPNDPRYLVVMKGAPERIIDRCKSIYINDAVVELGSAQLNEFTKAYEEMGGMGERVLGFCLMYLSTEEYPRGCLLSKDDEPLFRMDEFVFVGLASMIDPPRAAVPNAVKSCIDAGVKVIMVTGDHPITATAIARNVGIISGKAETFQEFQKRLETKGYEVALSEKDIAAVITGNDVKDMSSEEMDQVIKFHTQIVFARTSPQQKLIIVEGFQRSGAIVAVTGDGVNDSPALRKADIGVAMGIAGSDVAKQAADMILLDDNFASIVTGVRQGRIIFDNLKKSIAYTLTSNIPEIFPFLFHVLVGAPLPLGTITILCIDLGTDLLPATSLAYERAETDIMKRRPRNPKKDSLVNKILINYSYMIIGTFQTAAAFMVYVFVMLDNGFKMKQLITYERWGNPNVAYITDSFNQEWPYEARRDLERTCNTAYFFTIVIVQIADLLISKTRTMSIFTQGIFGNPMLIFSIFSEVILALCISYIPVINKVFQTKPVHPKYLVVAFIFSFIMFVLDECRRLYMRRHPGGFIQRETYY